MGLSFVVETGDGIRDGAGKSVGIGEGSVGELMLLQPTFPGFSGPVGLWSAC